MPTFKLPRGYSFTDPELRTADTVPDKGYGGADISQQFDATGIHYVACNAWGPGDPSFRWRAFKRIGAAYVEVPLPFVATGRGEQDVQWYDGKDWGIAWTASEFQFDTIPSFVPFPSIPSLDARIRALENAPPPDVGPPPFAASVPYLPQPIPGGAFVPLCGVTLPLAGVYAITLGVRWAGWGCGQIRLLLDGRMIARTDEGHAYQTLCATLHLPAGELVADCYGGGAVEWEDEWTGLRVVGLG